MATKEREKELFEALKQGVVSYDEEAVKVAAQAVIKEGVDAYTAIFEGLVEGMNAVGKLFEEKEYFVPEMLMCADALYAGLGILKPHIGSKNLGLRGTVLMGVVEGDVHDIGKNIVKLMFEVAGFEVHDLGKDVPAEKFVEEQLKTDSDIVCLSALMTTTMVGMKEVINKIKEKNPKCRIMVGGAPVTEELAEKFGADGYAKDATNAVKEALDMIKSLKEMQK